MKLYDFLHRTDINGMAQYFSKTDPCVMCAYRNTSCDGKRCTEGITKKLESEMNPTNNELD